MRLSVAGEVRARRASTRVDVRDKQVRERRRRRRWAATAWREGERLGFRAEHGDYLYECRD